MKHVVSDYEVDCDCVDGDCVHKQALHFRAFEGCVRHFSREMIGKLGVKFTEGRRGWDSDEWGIEDIKRSIIEHVEKGDFVDVANLAMFAWNKQ